MIELPTTPESSNVLFPSLLESHREKSIDYIQKFSSKNRGYLIRMYNQGKKIFPKVTTILSKYNLPSELKVLIALESGFNANAVSSAGAVGYWQLMDDVAREYGLKFSSPNVKAVGKKKVKDDRTNFLKSTSAAARYLKDRCRNLDNDILLMVASYNWGIGHVYNAMSRCRKSNPTFWDIKKYLPAETRNYVMNFITLNVIYYNYEKFMNRSLCFKPVEISNVKFAETPSIEDSTIAILPTE